MKTPTPHSTRVLLETVMIAFFILAALCLLLLVPPYNIDAEI